MKFWHPPAKILEMLEDGIVELLHAKTCAQQDLRTSSAFSGAGARILKEKLAAKAWRKKSRSEIGSKVGSKTRMTNRIKPRIKNSHEELGSKVGSKSSIHLFDFWGYFSERYPVRRAAGQLGLGSKGRDYREGRMK